MASGDDERHELHTGWSIWEQRELGKGMAYGDKLFKLCSFRTVEEFWAYWNNIPKPRYATTQHAKSQERYDRIQYGMVAGKWKINALMLSINVYCMLSHE
jgi:hypothetical protein